MHKPTMTMKLSNEEKEALREIAKGHGLLIGRGKEKDEGSIRGLNLAIAAGELVPVPRAVLERIVKGGYGKPELDAIADLLEQC